MKNFELILILVFFSSIFLHAQGPIHRSDQATVMNTYDVQIEENVDEKGFLERKVFSFDIFPNPSSSFVEVSKADLADWYCIYDMKGRKIECRELEEHIDVQPLQSGMYILSLYNQNSFIGRERFLKN